MSKWRFQVKSGKGGKYDRFYIWDTVEKRVYRGKIGKDEAIKLEHNLNGRALLAKKKYSPWKNNH